MKNLTEFINEAITKQLADLFDLSDANNFKVWYLRLGKHYQI